MIGSSSAVARHGPSPFVTELRERLAAAEADAESVATGWPPVWTECPECGAPQEKLKASQSLDERRDDLYYCVECTVCDWFDGGEV